MSSKPSIDEEIYTTKEMERAGVEALIFGVYRILCERQKAKDSPFGESSFSAEQLVRDIYTSMCARK